MAGHRYSPSRTLETPTTNGDPRNDRPLGLRGVRTGSPRGRRAVLLRRAERARVLLAGGMPYEDGCRTPAGVPADRRTVGGRRPDGRIPRGRVHDSGPDTRRRRPLT